jgi:hypothetical protein
MSYSNGPRIVTDGLVLCLDAGNNKSYPGTGTVWNDLSGNNNNGTLTNGPIFSSLNRGSIIFDGTNDYMIISTFSNTLASTLSLLYWIKYTQGGYIVQQNRSSSNILNQYNFQIIGNKLQFWDYSTSYGFTDNTSLNSSNTTLSSNIWYQVGFVKNGTSGIYYLNGQQDRTVTAASNVTYGNSNHVIGRDHRDNNKYFNGNIAQASIYNRALSPTEILQNYNATKGRYSL